jgi:translation elongation factor EF-Ts
VVAIEVNCETDFVARTPELLTFTDNLLKHFLKNEEPNDITLEDTAEIEKLLT